MEFLRLLGGAALVCCCACACSSNSGQSGSGSSPGVIGTSGDSGVTGIEHRSVDGSSSNAQGGAAGEGAPQRRDATEDGSGGAAGGNATATGGGATATDGGATATDGGSAGEAPSSGSIPPSGTDPEPTQCELNTSCVSNGKSSVVTCGVESTGTTCELEGFVGATAEVGNGGRVVVGTACCGGCGCTPVELYYDGTNCWQGIPECTLPQFMNQMYQPHHSTQPNPLFSPPSTGPGNFYLGSGGIGGAPTAAGGAGAGGTSSAGSGGSPAGGAPSDTGGTGGGAPGDTGGTGGAPSDTAGTGGGAPLDTAGTGGANAGTNGIAGSGGALATAGAPTLPEGGSTTVEHSF